ncbi:hypothetical protein GAY31_11420 [Azospirillum brasilense]|nr:hypothetical protein [Azospirillum brasilense]
MTKKPRAPSLDSEGRPNRGKALRRAAEKDPDIFKKWGFGGKVNPSEASKKVRHETRVKGGLGASGVPNGWTKQDVIAAQEAAKPIAQEKLQAMKDKDLVTLDDNRAEKALLHLLEVLEAKSDDGKYLYPVAERNKAAAKVLEFTKVKPVQKQEVKLDAAEQFLFELMKRDTSNE